MNENPRNSVALVAGRIDGDRKSWIEVMPTADKARNGRWYFTITRDDLDAVVASIAEKAGRAQVDYDHRASEGDSRAAGWFTGRARVIESGAATPYGLPALKDSVWAEVEWTPQAVQEIRDGVFKFVSAEWSMQDTDPKSGLMTKFREWVAATLTNRPFFTDLAPVQATATVDVTKIYLEELARITDANGLLPLEIAAHGSRIADDVTKILEERMQTRFTEGQWRSALCEALRRLTDKLGDTGHRSPNLADRKEDMSTLTSRYEPSAEDVRIAASEFDNGIDAVDMALVRIHARAKEILRAAGILDETEDEYISAYDQARRELAPVQLENMRGYTHGEGLDLHIEATKILRAQGLYENDYDGDQYAQALAEAEAVLAIDLKEKT